MANTKRINLYVDGVLVDKLDAYAEELHVSRSSALSVLLAQFFKAQEQMGTLAVLAKAWEQEQASKE